MRALLTVALFIALPVAASAAEFYPLDDLPSAVSPGGQLVLTSRYLWTASNGLTELGVASSEVWARDITNDGRIAGLWCGPNTGSCYEGFVSTIAGPGEGLGAFNGSASDAFAISANGSVVVGNSSSAEGKASFRWTSATGMVAIEGLTPAANSHSTANGVSADGSVIVGQSGDDTVLEAYRWTAETGAVGLGDLDASSLYSRALAVSADGNVIVGQATSVMGLEAFRWTEETGMVSLGTAADGDAYNIAYAASADGSMVVGHHEGDAFLWTAQEGRRKLQDVLISNFGLANELEDWRLTTALDISDDGRVIVGYGFNSAQEFQGFVVNVPEPASSTLLMLSFGCCVQRVIRRRPLCRR